MKEVTYEDWQKNPTPREMWVWDSSENNKKQRKVIYISDLGVSYPIFALADNKLNTEHFKHCAEIEKQKRMTNKELSRWLRENPTREFKYCNDGNDSFVSCFYKYLESRANEEVNDRIVIRENDSEWRESLVEVEE